MSGTDGVLPPSEPSVDVSRDGAGGRALRAFAVAATAATFLLICIGGLVRATGSGLGCTGWPRCTRTRWLPPLERHAIIEYTHRMTTFVVGVLVVVLAVIAWTRFRTIREVSAPAGIAVALLVFQAVLGGIVVRGELGPLLVTAHFMTAMLLAGTLVVATVAAFTVGREPGRGGPDDGLARLAWASVAAMFALLAVGTYVRGEGAGLAFRDWPLMDGRVIPGLSHLRPTLQFTHRALAAAVFVLVIALSVRAWRARAERPATAALGVIAAGLFAAQILVGASNVWSRLAPAAVTAHVAVAGILWGAVVGTAATAGTPALRSATARARVASSVPSGSPAAAHPEPISP